LVQSTSRSEAIYHATTGNIIYYQLHSTEYKYIQSTSVIKVLRWWPPSDMSWVHI